jgi:hypothetical protein
MSETKAHPERRAGQTWRLTKPDGMSKDYILSHRYGSTRWACVGFGECGLEDACWWDGRYEMTLIQDVPAAVPLAADRTKCEAWCGTVLAFDVDRMTHTDPSRPFNRGPEQRWCSYACMLAKHPPLAAQPAETARIEGHRKLCRANRGGDCNCTQPAPQPAPACAHGCSDVQANTACPTHGKPVTAKPVCERGANLHGGPVLLRCTGKGLFRKLCEHCYLAIEPLQKGPCGDVLHESDVPERLERPKLAHSFGVECPALEDA